jgi:hypothetical protein
VGSLGPTRLLLFSDSEQTVAGFSRWLDDDVNNNKKIMFFSTFLPGDNTTGDEKPCGRPRPTLSSVPTLVPVYRPPPRAVYIAEQSRT